MKAVVQVRYGSTDVLRLTDIDKPVPRNDEVRIRVHAAAVNIGDWHLMRGVPYVMRSATGVRKPRRQIPGHDVAGEVEAAGENVKQFRPGDEVFGWCKGAFAEYACAAESNLLSKPANLTFEQSAAVGDSAFTALAAVRDQGKVQPGHRVLVNGALAASPRSPCRSPSRSSERDRRLWHEERRHGAVDRRRQGHRLHEGGLHRNWAAIRRDARSGWESFAIRLPTNAHPPGEV